MRRGRLAEQLGQLSRLSHQVRTVLRMQMVRRRGTVTVDEHTRKAGPFAWTCLDSCHGSRDGSRTCVRRSHICRRRQVQVQVRFSAWWGLKKEKESQTSSEWDGSISSCSLEMDILTCDVTRTHRQVCINPYARTLRVVGMVVCAEGARPGTGTRRPGAGMGMRRRRKIDERSGR